MEGRRGAWEIGRQGEACTHSPTRFTSHNHTHTNKHTRQKKYHGSTHTHARAHTHTHLMISSLVIPGERALAIISSTWVPAETCKGWGLRRVVAGAKAAEAAGRVVGGVVVVVGGGQARW